MKSKSSHQPVYKRKNIIPVFINKEAALLYRQFYVLMTIIYDHDLSEASYLPDHFFHFN